MNSTNNMCSTVSVTPLSLIKYYLISKMILRPLKKSLNFFVYYFIFITILTKIILFLLKYFHLMKGYICIIDNLESMESCKEENTYDP